MITINFFGDKTKIKSQKTYQNLIKIIRQNFQLSNEELKGLLITYNDPIENERARLLPQIYDFFLQNSDLNIYIDFIEDIINKKENNPPPNILHQINNQNNNNLNNSNNNEDFNDNEMKKDFENLNNINNNNINNNVDLNNNEFEKDFEIMNNDESKENIEFIKSKLDNLNLIFGEQEKAYKHHLEKKELEEKEINKENNNINIVNNENKKDLKENIENIISNYLNQFKNEVIQETILETKYYSEQSKIQLMKNNQKKINLKNLDSNKKYDIFSSNRNVCETIHYGIKCNGCGIYPIKGLRFKCTVCPDFNYCYNCEENEDHEHPFYKIRFPLNN